MTLVEPTLLSLARAAAIALATMVALVLAGPGLGQDRGVARTVFWLTLMALLAPAFPGMGLLLQKQGADIPYFLFYELRVWLRYGPLALIPLWLMPPPFSDYALHCFRTGTASNWWRRWRWRMRALGPALWLGAALVFLFAFQEFELATTWNIRSWTVALFDAQVGGLALTETLRLAIFPVAIQVLVLAAIVFRLRRVDGTQTTVSSRGFNYALLPIFGALIFCIPLYMLSAMGLGFLLSPGGIASLARVAPWREMGNGAGLALAATIFAWPVAGWIAARRGLRLLLLVPGLLGPLVTGLLLLAVCRIPGLDAMRDSVFTPVLGLVLVMLPYGVLMRLGLQETSNPSALFVARQAQARWPLWKMDRWPKLAMLLLLFFFAYSDFGINSLLAPPQFVSAGVRLLNLLHYGFSQALVQMYAAAVLAPLLAMGLTAIAAHLYARRRVR